MASVNKVILVGNLGRDPELRDTGSQKVCEFSLATNERWKDGSGEYQERTEWHRIIVWGRQGENAARYLTKGRSVYVEGRIQTRQWQDKDGVDRYTTEIVASSVQFLSGDGDGDRAPAVSQKQKPPVDDKHEAAAPTFFDDEIPF